MTDSNNILNDKEVSPEDLFANMAKERVTKKKQEASDLFNILATKHIKENSKNLSDNEARFLVSAYYQIQNDRIRSNNQIRAITKEGECSNLLLSFLAERYVEIELMIKKALDYYTSNHAVGQWLKSVHGIGPVIAAGLLAHIDISKAPTAGHIWSYAGLDPNMVWEKGQKRPFNADLKRICWLASESFVKHSGSPKCVYGHIYIERKTFEIARNESGGNAEIVAKDLERKKYKKETEAYQHLLNGKLPPAQIQARAQRYAVKIFLSHLQQLWWEWEFGVPAPKPYAIAILGHARMIEAKGSIPLKVHPDTE